MLTRFTTCWYYKRFIDITSLNLKITLKLSWHSAFLDKLVNWNWVGQSSIDNLLDTLLKLENQQSLSNYYPNYSHTVGSVVGIATAYGWSGDRIAVGTRFSAPVQTSPEAHQASSTMGTGSLPGVRCGRGVMLTPHPLPMPRSKIEYSYTSTLHKGLCGLWKGETYLLPYHITEIVNAAFCRKNGIQSERARNKLYFLTFQPPPQRPCLHHWLDISSTAGVTVPLL